MDILNNLYQSAAAAIGPFVPALLGALLMLIATIVLSRLLRTAINRLGQRTGLDERLKSPGITRMLSEIVYWFVWLLGLPLILGPLGLSSVLEPITSLTNRVMGFLPSLFGAVAVMGIGFIVARIVRMIVTNLLTAAGSEKLAERLGMTSAFGANGLAGTIGTLLFVLILLPVIATALQPLGFDAVAKPVTALIDTIMGLLPKLIGAAIIIVFAIVIGRIVADLVSSILAGAGANKLGGALGLGKDAKIAGRTPAELAGTLVFGAILITALTQAADVIGVDVLRAVIGDIGTVAAHIVSGLFIIGIALILANAVARGIAGSTVSNAPVLALVARGAILFFAIPLSLRQMGLPTEIVTLGFGLVMGAITIAVSIAFGIGGRHAAARIANRLADSMMNTPSNTGDRTVDIQ